MVQRVGDGHEVGIAKEHERGTMCHCELDRSERVLDSPDAFSRPSKNTGAEAAQRALVGQGHRNLLGPKPEKSRAIRTQLVVDLVRERAKGGTSHGRCTLYIRGLRDQVAVVPAPSAIRAAITWP
jgi:hypothetical protein